MAGIQMTTDVTRDPVSVKGLVGHLSAPAPVELHSPRSLLLEAPGGHTGPRDRLGRS